MKPSADTRLSSDRILLAVDPGGRKTGLARRGASGIITPIGIIESRHLDQGVDRIAAEIDSSGAELCIIGLPLDAEGRETGGCRRSRALGRALEERGYRVHYQPEYLTTHEARERAREIGRPASAPVDDLAAVILLEDYLAHPARGGEDGD